MCDVDLRSYPYPTPRRLAIVSSPRTNPPFPSTPFFPTSDMADPGSVRFQAFIDRALHDYEKKSGVTSADSDDSLAIQLQRCHSPDSIATLLRDKMQDLNDFRQRDRIFKSIEATVSIFTPISAVASTASNAGLVRQKVQKSCLCISDRLYSHMRKQSILLSAPYWMYVPCLSSYVNILLTSRSIRRPMA